MLHFRDGKHSSFNLMFDRLQMLEQLGLPPTQRTLKGRLAQPAGGPPLAPHGNPGDNAESNPQIVSEP